MNIQKVNVEMLRNMIREKLSADEKEKRRKKKLMGFDSGEHIDDEHLKALGRGIIKDDCEGNANHDEDGRFSDDDGDGSYSLPSRTGCKRKTGQYKRKGKSASTNREPCGRLDRSRLCKENEEHKQKDLYYRERLEALIRDTIRQELSKAARANNCSMNDILRALNRFSAAEKGKLNTKGKGAK